MAQQTVRDTGPSADRPDVPSCHPFRQFILKVHGHCNLACRYCYLYEAADHGWRDRPAAMSDAVLDRTTARIAGHAAAHGLRHAALVLHGGEPLLAGADRLGRAVDLLRTRLPGDCALHPTIQTNGTLLTRTTLRTLAGHGIRVGVSLDGGLPAHNAARVDHAGRPAWSRAVRGLRLLAEERPEAYAGILAVVDPRTDPVETYASLRALRPPRLDLLLPHGNWTTPPPGLTPGADRTAPYGDWLRAVFDAWWDGGPGQPRIRLFEECLALLLGAPAGGESLGLTPFTAVVVETDGSIEQVDSLKSAYEGAAATGLDVFRHSFDEALAHPGIAARHAGAASLALVCRACPLVRVCGGGQYAHRYRRGSGFANPSVYCADLQRLIRHAAERLATTHETGRATRGPAR